MHIAYCNKVTKVTNPISDFTFLSTAKSGKSRIKNPFLDSPKGTHPKVPREHFVQGIRFQKHVVTLQARTTCAEVVTQIFIITLLSVTPEPSVLNTEYVFIKSAC